LRFLVDNNLAPALAAGLCTAGHDAIHTANTACADDQEIFEDRIVISADTDFGTLLAQQGGSKPSVIIFRRTRGRRPDRHLDLILSNLDGIADYLESGCVAVFEDA
jgi:predicted nuclease of predicted toxin-antitoxin system